VSAAAAAAAVAARQRALADLMTRICSRPEFPSLSHSVGEIQRVVRSELSHRRALTDGVLRDVGLTARLLQIINAACYRSVGAGTITSVERALSLVGYQAVGMMTVSAVLFDRLPKGIDGARVRADFSRALLAGLLAQELCHSGRHLENSYLTALYMNLGQMLLSLHFPEAAEEIDRRLDAAEPDAAPGARLHAERLRVSAEVLGISTEDLGCEVAAQWGWPEALREHLRRHYPVDTRRTVPDHDYLRVLGTGACDLSARIHQTDHAQSPEELAACIEQFAAAFGGPLALDGPGLQQAVGRALEQWQALASVLGVDSAMRPARARPRLRLVGQEAPAAKSSTAFQPSRQTSPAESTVSDPRPPRPRERGGADAPQAPEALEAVKAPHEENDEDDDDDLTNQANLPTDAADPAAPVDSGRSERATEPPEQAAAAGAQTAQAALSAAVARASEHALSDAPLDAVVPTVLEDLRRALSLRQVALCLRTAAGPIRARFAAGEVSARVLGHFSVVPGSRQDLFALLCEHGRDTLISDTTQPKISAHLPAWFKEQVAAGSFVVLPMRAGSRLVGLLYADQAQPGGLHLDDHLLGLLGTLRNQLLLALRLRSRA
jgi:HD-like signal output (HDOD) protein